MKIKFLGAARTVTGSCYLVETERRRFAVDCGMHQGSGEIEKRNWDAETYNPAGIDFFLVTHAHIDHAGLLPRMVQKGFRGKIYTTPPTRDLLEIMLLDSAHVQEMEIQWRNKKRTRHGEKNIQPLYRQQDVLATIPFFEERFYDVPFSPLPGVKVNFRDAGHILGASIVELWIEENGTQSKLVFSGDIGRPAQLLVEDTAPVRTADFLFLESTYGDRDHHDPMDPQSLMAKIINETVEAGGNIIIPTFALDRAQSLLYYLGRLIGSDRVPHIMTFLDSPMAAEVTGVFERHPEYLDQEAEDLFRSGRNPFRFPGLKMIHSSEESKAINRIRGSCVILAGSGMCTGGRIKHHLVRNISRPDSTILFVGYQAKGTLGRQILEHAPEVRIFGQPFPVKARIEEIHGFSAHAGQSGLLEWLGHFQQRPSILFLVHGEREAGLALAERLKKDGWNVHVPEYKEDWELKLTRLKP